MGSASVGLQNAVSDIQDRYRDIQKLEQVWKLKFLLLKILK
jgi:hypothetical protein